MKILIDGRFWGLENAGLGRYTMNLIPELAKLGKYIKYYILLRKKHYSSVKLPGNCEKVLADLPHYTLTEQIKLPEIISKINPDVTHFLHINVPLNHKGKFIVTVHDLLMQKHRGASATTLPFFLYYPKQFAAKLVIGSAVKKAVEIVTPSKTVKSEIIEYYGLPEDKIVVTYEGVSKKADKPTFDVRMKHKIDFDYFLYVGNTYPHKNLKRAVEALLRLNKKRGKSIKLLMICSRNVFVKRFGEEISKLGAGNVVNMLGYVPDQDLQALYTNSIAFVFPSISEGFGLPGLEAMSAGTIVLASQIDVFKEIYQDVPIYFDPYSIPSIEKGMEKALDLTTADRATMIRKGEILASKFDWRQTAKETLKVYESVLQEPTGNVK